MLTLQLGEELVFKTNSRESYEEVKRQIKRPRSKADKVIQGELHFLESGTYIRGTWTDHVFNGMGAFHSEETPYGELTYSGEFQNLVSHGKGTETNLHGDRTTVVNGFYCHGFSHGQGKLDIFYGADENKRTRIDVSYEGQFKHSRTNGHGVCTYANVQRRTGMFVPGLILHGDGCMIEFLTSHSVYHGQVFNNRICGLGVMTNVKTGTRKEGHWKDGYELPQGHITKEIKDGVLFIGQLNTKGEPLPGEKWELVYPPGDKLKDYYVGQLSADFQRDGLGTLYCQNGFIQYGLWTRGSDRSQMLPTSFSYIPDKSLEIHQPNLSASLSKFATTSHKAHCLVKRVTGLVITEVIDLVLSYGYLLELMLEVMSRRDGQ